MKTDSTQFLKTATALLALSTTILFAEKKAAITHSFLGVGKANQVVIVGLMIMCFFSSAMRS